MGKRFKKKAQNGLKEKRVSTPSSKAVQKENNHTSKIVDDGVVLGKERKVCVHFEKGVDVAKVSSILESAESTGCEDCREGMIDRKDGKGKEKHGKKKGGSKATWICLHCGHFSCGGVGLPNSRQTHAVRHASQSRHPLVIQMENTNRRWCFACKSLIPVDKVDDTGEQKDDLLDIVKLLKKQFSKASSIDAEDIWFGSGSVIGNVKSENNIVSLPNGTDFYAVRGLANLGNTCFFNSVMQNLLAIDMLREYLLTFDGLMGPLTSALKKIYVETSSESGVRNVINPKPLFGCICARSSQFRGYQQQDSHELLRCLLDELSTEDLRTKKSDKSSQENVASLPASATFIDAIFGGQISSTVCCVECGHSSVVHEPFLDLSLPLPAKKPPHKKARPASGTKKTKLPPKRVGRHHPKLNKDVDSRPTVSGCDPSSNSESSSIFKEAPLCCSSSADLVEPTVVVDRKGLGSQDYNSTQPDNASTQVSGSGGQKDVVRLDYLGPVTQSDAREAFSWLDYLEPVSLSDNQNLFVKDEDVLVDLESGRNDVNHNIDAFQDAVNLSEEVGVDTGNKDVNTQSTVHDQEDDHVLQIQGNKVLLPTYKEDQATTVGDGKKDIETSLLTAGDEDTLDFIGLGDLFDEPKAATLPSIVSNNMEGSAHLGNGLLAGYNTESDPDELDHKDLPVSVESCLAHFVKAELLSGEHAWHCENCSKLQQEERRNLKNQQKSAPMLQENMSKDECPGSEVVQVRSHPCKDCSNSVFHADSNGSSWLDKNLKSHVPLQINGFGPTLPKEQAERYEPKIACTDANGISVCPELPHEANSGGKSVECCSRYADQVPAERLSGFEEHKSGEDEEDDINSSSVKAMRDVTKRILISKTPTILTIHLKRFGQDTRGRLSKLKGHVVFKEFIDLRPYLDNRSTMRDKSIYRLVGVVVHSGSMTGGHYVAYVRGGDRSKARSQEENHRPRHNVWYYASDAYVREVTLEEVLHSEAYILFYEKVQL